MRRVNLEPRPGWQKRLEEAGCFYHTIDGKPYWREDAAYVFTATEIDAIEDATNRLQVLCMEHVRETVQVGDYEGYGFPDEVKQLIQQSWHVKEPSLYGRFDLGYDGKAIKLFELNGDTPTALPEASVWQWHVAEDRGWGTNQFNSIHEKLVEQWGQIIPWSHLSSPQRLHFTAAKEGQQEDWGNVHYLVETAVEAGYNASSLAIDAIGWSDDGQCFTDEADRPIETLFKLYPWEWLMAEEYGWKVRAAKTHFIEPAWKMLLSTKALLPLLWKKNPGHLLLLEAYFEADFGNLYKRGGDWVRKPLLGREGANVAVVSDDGKTRPIRERNPQYDKHGYILQRFFAPQMFRMDGQYDGIIHDYFPVIGSWIVGDRACGIGLREEASSWITTNASQFVPHYFEDAT